MTVPIPSGDEPADQQITTAYVMVNGARTPATAATMKALHAAATVYTFTRSISFAVNGAHLAYRKGQSYSLTPAVQAALLAASAPMTAA